MASKRKWWLTAGAVAVLTAGFCIFQASKVQPLPAFLMKFKAKTALVEKWRMQSGDFWSYRGYLVDAPPAEVILSLADDVGDSQVKLWKGGASWTDYDDRHSLAQLNAMLVNGETKTLVVFGESRGALPAFTQLASGVWPALLDVQYGKAHSGRELARFDDDRDPIINCLKLREQRPKLSKFP
jgi:hypothetical protein